MVCRFKTQYVATCCIFVYVLVHTQLICSLHPVLNVREPCSAEVLAAALGAAHALALAATTTTTPALPALVHRLATALKILIKLCSKWTWVMPQTASSPYAIIPSPRSGTSRGKSTRRLSASQSRISNCFFLIEHESLAPHQQQLSLSLLSPNALWHLMASKMVPKSDA